MLDDADLAGQLGALVATTRPKNGIFYRASPATYTGDPLAKGRLLKAARYNLEPTRALYLSSDFQTCLDETNAFAFPTAITIFPVQVRLVAVLDVAAAAVLQILQTTTAELSANFRSSTSATPSQRLGELCAQSGRIDGLLFESVARQGGHKNLVVFESCLRALGSSIVCTNPLSGKPDGLP